MKKNGFETLECRSYAFCFKYLMILVELFDGASRHSATLAREPRVQMKKENEKKDLNGIKNI